MMRDVEPTQMMDAVTASMQQRTGRTLEEWVSVVQQESGADPLDQPGVRAWLKAQGVPQNSQWAIAFEVAGRAGWVMPTPDKYADELFTGRKAALRPLHDAVVAAATALGDDTQVQGRNSYTPVVRRTQFVAVAPGPRSTLRVGFRFRDTVPTDERLEPAKNFAQATHWLHLPADADPASAVAGLEPLLVAAYQQNG